jgi:pimeloyl-ACP methyl ester carboxylesterase
VVAEATSPWSPWTDWGGVGPPMVFTHANGFPPSTYRSVLDELCMSFRVSSFAARPLWPDSRPDDIDSWNDLASDLLSVLEQRAEPPLVAVGHSLGGTLSVLVAAARPRLFSGLVLIDPVIFAGIRALFWGSISKFGCGRKLPLIQGALRRRDHFPDLESVRAAYGAKPVFSTWETEVLDDYVRAGFRDTGDGVELRYPKAWEARIFELTPVSVWRQLRSLNLPVLVIRGGRSDTFLPAAARKLGRLLPRSRIVEMPGRTHFVPMEAPQSIAEVISRWADETGILD